MSSTPVCRQRPRVLAETPIRVVRKMAVYDREILNGLTISTGGECTCVCLTTQFIFTFYMYALDLDELKSFLVKTITGEDVVKHGSHILKLFVQLNWTGPGIDDTRPLHASVTKEQEVCVQISLPIPIPLSMRTSPCSKWQDLGQGILRSKLVENLKNVRYNIRIHDLGFI